MSAGLDQAALFIAALIVVDGDTVKHAPTKQRLRLIGMDAPERHWRADCHSEAIMGEYVANRVRALLARVVAVEGDGEIDFYQRPLVSLRLDDGRTVADVLIEERLAVPWAGKRHDWCGDQAARD